MRSASLSLVVACLLACGGPAPEVPRSRPRPHARAYVQADRLFHQDPRFLGADGAFSVELEPGRILWLFGDTFVAPAGAAPSRVGARMTRNSIAIQTGDDPTTATMEHHFGRASDGEPADFFPGAAPGWVWPGDGVVVDGALTVFVHRQQPSADPDGLGFVPAGWGALRVEDPSADPGDWRLLALPTPTTPSLVVGASLSDDGSHVYAYAVREPGDHAVLLLRWSRARFVAGDLLGPEFYRGPAAGYGPGAGVVVIASGATEFSVDALSSGGFVQVESRGFGGAPIALRYADALEGPFGPAYDVFRPEEAGRPRVLVYAAKAHSELRGPGLLVTYATNSLDTQVLMSDLSLYFPRFVVVDP